MLPRGGAVHKTVSGCTLTVLQVIDFRFASVDPNDGWVLSLSCSQSEGISRSMENILSSGFL